MPNGLPGVIVLLSLNGMDAFPFSHPMVRPCNNNEEFLIVITIAGCSSYSEVLHLRDSYSMSPNHQFFDNDFRVLQNSQNGFIFCPFSGIPPHQLIHGPLVDGFRFPFNRQDLPFPSAHFHGKTDQSMQWFPASHDDLLAASKADLVSLNIW